MAWAGKVRLIGCSRTIGLGSSMNRRTSKPASAGTRQIAKPRQSWADAWLLAFAQAAQGTLVTFDRALAARGARCLLPVPEPGTD
jgi:hypothetical protein